jgi:cell division protein FtsB
MAPRAKIRFHRRGARALLAGMNVENVDLGIWSKLTKVVVGLVVLAVLLLMGMCYLPLIQQNERMRREKLRLEMELENETAKSRQLQAQIDALRNDPKTVERLMREKLGYAKPDETVIRFEPSTTNAAVRQ